MFGRASPSIDNLSDTSHAVGCAPLIGCTKVCAANAQGVANRDLKLENLLLDREEGPGNRPLLKICDFGYSKHEMNSSAKTNVGTPIYMAPEIILGSNRYNAKVCPPPCSAASP